MADAKKIDPFDVEALEKSLNDSATRVSTIWVSFLIFSLYLLIAATTVTHRQLFLAEAVKLPALNIDLPLWGFFWLAPILFVIFHAYVLIQLILLARTAKAYDTAVAKLIEQDSLSREANVSLRQRLANTLFAQIFAGSPREREGWFGSLLKAMAWITLVVAPILILLTCQFMFLPYHSHLATWTHRLLILLEFVVAFQLWPLVLKPQHDFRTNWRRRIRDRAYRVTFLFWWSPRMARGALQQLVLPVAAAVLFILISLSLATFPGEPHVNLFTGQAIDDVQCRRWIQQKFDFADMRFDRLALARVDVVDHDKLEKIQQATSKAGEQPYQGERTRVLRDRDLNCGDFSDYADLRRIDLSGAHLRNANFRSSKLEGVSFARSQLRDAALDGAKLQGASFERAELLGTSFSLAELQGASFSDAQLQGASFILANLQGATLDDAKLQGASLDGTDLQGASLDRAKLQGASLVVAELQAASLERAELQAASLVEAKLQGASLDSSKLQGASLNGAKLQGASFRDANLSDATLSGIWIWGARNTNCTNARVTDPKTDAVVALKGDLGKDPIPATPDQIEKVITEWVAQIPEGRRKENARKVLRERLTVAEGDTAALGEAWYRCESESRKISQDEFDGRQVAVLRGVACDAESGGAAIAKGILRNWILEDNERREFAASLARALLGEDGKPCAPARDYDEYTKERLRGAAGPPHAAALPVRK